MVIKWSMSYIIHGSVASCEIAKDDLDVIGQDIKESLKAEIGNHISSFKTARYECWWNQELY